MTERTTDNPRDILSQLLEVARAIPTTQEQKKERTIKTAKLVRNLRESLNLTPIELARGSNVAVQIVYRWESGKLAPRLHYLMKLKSLPQFNESFTDSIMESYTKAETAVFVHEDPSSLASEIPRATLRILSKFEKPMILNFMRATEGEFRVIYFVPEEQAAVRTWKLQLHLGQQLLSTNENLFNKYSTEKFEESGKFENFINSRNEMLKVGWGQELSSIEKQLISGAANMLTDLDNKRRINVHIVSPLACVNPTLVLKMPDEVIPKTGWIWYFPWEMETGVKIPAVALDYWREQFGHTPESRFTFEKALGKITEEAELITKAWLRK